MSNFYFFIATDLNVSVVSSNKTKSKTNTKTTYWMNYLADLFIKMRKHLAG